METLRREHFNYFICISEQVAKVLDKMFLFLYLGNTDFVSFVFRRESVSAKTSHRLFYCKF